VRASPSRLADRRDDAGSGAAGLDRDLEQRVAVQHFEAAIAGRRVERAARLAQRPRDTTLRTPDPAHQRDVALARPGIGERALPRGDELGPSREEAHPARVRVEPVQGRRVPPAGPLLDVRQQRSAPLGMRRRRQERRLVDREQLLVLVQHRERGRMRPTQDRDALDFG
jgi:hypothetical protein